MCSNCAKRGRPCSYAPYPTRRGPGKAPKGQRKLALREAGPSGTSSGYASATSTEQDMRPSGSREAMRMPNVHTIYSPYPEQRLTLPREHAMLPNPHLPPIQHQYMNNSPLEEIPHPQYPHTTVVQPEELRERGIWETPSHSAETTPITMRDDSRDVQGSSAEMYELIHHDSPPPAGSRPPPHPPRRDSYR